MGNARRNRNSKSRGIMAASLILVAATWSLVPPASAAAAESAAYDLKTSRRQRNLDHWDVETAAAYLGLERTAAGKYVPAAGDEDGNVLYAGHDASIMFYASWCKNCHSLATSYDAIGNILEAGTTRSGIIMALFDCERDDDAAELCVGAGVTGYPTVMYVGAGTYHDTDPLSAGIAGRDKAAGPMGATPSGLDRVVKFQGDWRYGDSVLDWIKAMRGLSRWHRLSHEGWLSVVRRGLFGLFRKGGGRSTASASAGSLPVGIPPKLEEARALSASDSSSDSARSNQASTAEVKELKKDIKQLKEGVLAYRDLVEESNKAVQHAGYTIDSLLLPVAEPKEGSIGAGCVVEGSDPPYVDPFMALDKSGGWNAIPTDDGGATQLSDEYVLNKCVVDLSLDYCTRLSSRVTTTYLDELSSIPDDSEDYPALSDLDRLLTEREGKIEPYCAEFTNCYLDDFKGEKCHPAKCPFKNDIACRYISDCLDSRISEEYKDALAAQADEAKADAAETKTSSSGTSSDGGTASAWGVA